MDAEQLTDATAQLFGVRRADLFSHNRTARVAQARQALAWALRKNDWSLDAIGDYLRRDHTTIIYAVAAMDRRSAHQPRLAEKLAALVETYSAPIDWPARVADLERRVAELEKRISLCTSDGSTTTQRNQ